MKHLFFLLTLINVICCSSTPKARTDGVSNSIRNCATHSEKMILEKSKPIIDSLKADPNFASFLQCIYSKDAFISYRYFPCSHSITLIQSYGECGSQQQQKESGNKMDISCISIGTNFIEVTLTKNWNIIEVQEVLGDFGFTYTERLKKCGNSNNQRVNLP